MARDVPRHVLARRGLLALVGLALVFTFVTLRTNGTFGSTPHVTAVVADAGGALRKGSDVKLDGAVVGKVSSVSRDASGGVAVDMEMSSDDLDHVPANVVARILPATVFGTTFVDLVVHGDRSSASLEAGSVVPADRSQATLEFQQALDDIDRLVKALGPAELASAIGSAARALDGRGGQLAAVVNTLNSYLARINPRLPAVRADLDDLARSTAVLDDVAPDLLDATDDSLGFLGDLVRQEAAVTSLIAGGTDLANVSSDFLDANQQRLVRWIRGTGTFVDVLYDNRRVGITDAITLNLRIGRKLPTTIDDGQLRTVAWLRFDQPDYYGEGDRPTFASLVGQAG
ncbi:MCE family protein [Nocardioides sp. MH1]|uniref:MCE family protein n=1 Tax=Nocardioides sp. MH1 TaxID=3242490 RepID=UPI0035211DEF